MSNEQDLSQQDLSATDLRTVTPAEWEALKREVKRRAQVEQANAMRALVQAVRSWWQARKLVHADAARNLDASGSLRFHSQSRV